MRGLMLIGCFALGGCGVVARNDARMDYQASTAQYKACVAVNPPASCEGARLAMEADERKFTNLSAGLNPSSQSTANLTVLNR